MHAYAVNSHAKLRNFFRQGFWPLRFYTFSQKILLKEHVGHAIKLTIYYNPSLIISFKEELMHPDSNPQPLIPIADCKKVLYMSHLALGDYIYQGAFKFYTHRDKV
ncbi:MAG: hypothetical protein NZ697_03440 [Porticoccaceae bacterium]|nr:hypothetical protein [Porticoccaceae bacterium]